MVEVGDFLAEEGGGGVVGEAEFGGEGLAGALFLAGDVVEFVDELGVAVEDGEVDLELGHNL